MRRVDVEVGVSLDPAKVPARRDVVRCRLSVDGPTLRLSRLDGGRLLEVSTARVRATALAGRARPAAALLVDGSLLRLDFGRRTAPGGGPTLRRVRGAAARVRAHLRRRRVLHALT